MAPSLLLPRFKMTALVIAVVVSSGLSGCVSTDRRDEDMDHVSSPKGANPPKGVLEIDEGMTQQEVLAILSPLYPVIHAAAALESNPIVDSFPYWDGASRRFIEVIYRPGGRVRLVRFGFEESYGIL